MTNEQEPENGPIRNTGKNAGGFFIAAGCIVGTVGGGLLGQPSIGFLGGLAAGAVVAIAMWYFDL